MTDFRERPLPEILRGPPRGRVLVVAPHPDDETMGAGGTIALHGDQGDEVTALFVCNGIQGDPAGYFPRDGIVEIRQREAEEAARILGIRHLRFLGYPDNLSDADIHVFENLPEDPAEARRALALGFAAMLFDVVREGGFDIVYHPWQEELNRDHWVVGQGVAHLLRTRGAELAGVAFLGYDVWSPLIPDTVVDISDAMERKLAAVAAYKSQNLYGDYRHAVQGLDAYRSLLLPRGAKYGEGFQGRYGRRDR